MTKVKHQANNFNLVAYCSYFKAFNLVYEYCWVKKTLLQINLQPITDLPSIHAGYSVPQLARR